MFKKSHDVHLNNPLIIKLVKERPEIWDKSSILYRDQQKNNEAWKSILQKLFRNWDDCSDEVKSILEQMVVKRWCNIRDSYAKSYRKYKDQKESGVSSPQKYIYHNHLAFLEPLHNFGPSSSVHKEKTEMIKSDEVKAEDGGEDLGELSADELPSYEVPIDVDDNLFLGTITPTISDEPNPLNFADGTTISKYVDLLHHMSRKMSDRHDMFFQGLLPSLKDFNEDETLELQINVMQYINNIKEQRDSK